MFSFALVQSEAFSQLANTNDEQFLNVWQGGSRSPSAIFQSGNRDVDIAIHPLIKV